MSKKRLMPYVYRWLLTVSAVTFFVTVFALSGPELLWGVYTQVILVTASVLLIAAGWGHSRLSQHLATYFTLAGGSLLVATAVLLSYPAKWSAVVVWSALTIYTASLAAFGWIREVPDVG